MAGEVWQGLSGQGGVWFGVTRKAGLGAARQAGQGAAGRGKARRVMAREGRHGEVCSDGAWYGRRREGAAPFHTIHKGGI